MSNTALSEDFKRDSLEPLEERFRDPERVWNVYIETRKRDPQANKRAAILKSYYRYPHKVKDRDRTCSLVDPYITNYGLLGFFIDQIKTGYMDMIYERENAFKIETLWEPEGQDPNLVARRRKEWGKHISYAFEEFFIREWDGFDYNMDLDVFELLLYGRGIEHWPNPTGAYSTHVDVERVHPNLEATHLPCSWDYVSVEQEIPLIKLWRMAQKDPGFDKQAVASYIKYSCKEYERKNEEFIIKEWEDGRHNRTMENRTAELVWFYAKEFDAKGKKQISMYVLPQSYGDYHPKHVGRRIGKFPFLARKPYFFEKMEHAFCPIIDNIGHGKWYYTPSFAEKIFVLAKAYDRKLNSSSEANEINSMLMTQGGDASAGKAASHQAFRNRLHFAPGTTPVQVRYELPALEGLEFARQFRSDASTGIGHYETGSHGRSAKSNPTATQVEADVAASTRLNSNALKRFNIQLTKHGRELYRRFAKVTAGDEEWDSRERFIEYLEKKGVPKEAFDPKNIRIRSVMIMGAGAPTLKHQTAVRTLDILNIVPRTEGQALAQREAIAALNGIQNVDQYFEGQQQDFPGAEDKQVGEENELMRKPGFQPHNLPVLASENHILHLLGSTQSGGVTVGHIEDAAISLQAGLELLQDEPIPSDVPLQMDRIAEIINELDNKIQHSQEHRQYLIVDMGKKAELNRVDAMLAELQRRRDELAGNYTRAQEARLEQAQQMQQGDPQLQAAQEKAQIEVDKAAQLATIDVQKKTAEAEVTLESKAKQAAIEADKGTAKAAIELAKEAGRAEQTRERRKNNYDPKPDVASPLTTGMPINGANITIDVVYERHPTTVIPEKYDLYLKVSLIRLDDNLRMEETQFACEPGTFEDMWGEVGNVVGFLMLADDVMRKRLERVYDHRKVELEL